MIKTFKIDINTLGNCDLVDITQSVEKAVTDSGLKEGHVIVFGIGSTLSITTIEYEPGLKEDIKKIFEEIVPSGRNYSHNKTWGDGNGHSHLRSAIVGTSLTVPFEKGRLLLGTWQQIVCVDFDTHSRKRKIVIQVNGE